MTKPTLAMDSDDDTVMLANAKGTIHYLERSKSATSFKRDNDDLF